jgi:hypothetical protein
VHSTTGYATLELSSTRELAPSVWARQPSLTPKDRDGKYKLRQAFLDRASRLCSAAADTANIRLGRYKYLYDHPVRRRHDSLQVGDYVFVRTYMLEPGRYPKLAATVSGPYPVIRLEGPNVVILTREGRETLHLDRVIRCPTDLPSGVAWAPRKEVPKSVCRRAVEPDDEFVIDRFVSHDRADDDYEWLIRVRSAGFSAADDSWEPARELPAELVGRYERRKKLQAGLLTRSKEQRLEKSSRFGPPALRAPN